MALPSATAFTYKATNYIYTQIHTLALLYLQCASIFPGDGYARPLRRSGRGEGPGIFRALCPWLVLDFEVVCGFVLTASRWEPPGEVYPGGCCGLLNPR